MVSEQPFRALAVTIVGLLLAFAAITYIALAAWKPTIGEPRDELLATPSLPGLATKTDVSVPGRQELCVRPVVIPARTTRVTAQATGVVAPTRMHVSIVSVEGQLNARKVSVAGTSLDAYFDRRQTSLTSAAVCFRNRQRRAVAFVGTTEPRSRVVADTFVNGRRKEADIALSLLGGTTTLGHELPRSAQRAATMAGIAWAWWAVPALLIMLVVGGVCLVWLLAATYAQGRRRLQ
jgi:hypothetical protein